MADTPESVAALRAQVDRVDARLAELLNERAGLARELRQAKRALGLPALDPRREEEVFARAAAAAQAPLDPAAMRRIFEAILRESRRIVQA